MNHGLARVTVIAAVALPFTLAALPASAGESTTASSTQLYSGGSPQTCVTDPQTQVETCDGLTLFYSDSDGPYGGRRLSVTATRTVNDPSTSTTIETVRSGEADPGAIAFRSGARLQSATVTATVPYTTTITTMQAGAGYPYPVTEGDAGVGTVTATFTGDGVLTKSTYGGGYTDGSAKSKSQTTTQGANGVLTSTAWGTQYRAAASLSQTDWRDHAVTKK